MKRPTVEQWRIFIKTIQLGNFAKVADAFDTDAAFIGKSIARLEAYLGEPLFIRTRPKLSPTWLAEKLAPKIASALTSIDQLFNADDDDKDKNRYRIGVPNSFAKLFLHWISDFQEIEPNASYEIVPYDLSTGFDIGCHDLVVAQRTLPMERVFAKALGKNCRILVATKEFARTFEIEKPEDLRQIPLVSSRNQQILTSKGVHMAMTIKSVIKVSDSVSALECALHGQCCAVGIPVWAAQPLINEGQCVQILPEWTCQEEEMWLVRPQRRYRDANHRRLAEYLFKRWRTECESTKGSLIGRLSK